MHRDNRMYEWTVLATLPLVQPRRAAFAAEFAFMEIKAPRKRGATGRRTAAGGRWLRTFT